MTLDVAVYLLVLCVAGIVASAILLRKKKTLRIVCIVLLSFAALAFAVYLGLGLILLDSIRNQVPAA